MAWVSLDGGDNDGTRLAAHLVDALQHPRTGTRAARRSNGWRRAARRWARTSSIVWSTSSPTRRAGSLVLHNVDALTNPVLIDELGVLIEQAPPQINFVVARHSDWPTGLHGLRLSRWRHLPEPGRSRVSGTTTLGPFSAGLRSGSSPSRKSTQLVIRTEGWAAGLQLAAIKLRHEGDTDRFIESFHGDDRHVADYLTAEVLAHQPPPVRKFLLETSVLDRMVGPLCDALTGTNDGHAMLERLERDGLFHPPSGHARGWFRYHQLFRDLLRHELRSTDPDARGAIVAASGRLASESR